VSLGVMHVMRILILYIPILIAVVLPFLFRRTYGVGVLSAVILCAVALLHFTHLMAVHRIVMEDGVRQLAVASGGQLPSDFRVAVDSIQKYSHQQMWPFAALIGALAPNPAIASRLDCGHYRRGVGEPGRSAASHATL
jgi:hypothetical protein